MSDMKVQIKISAEVEKANKGLEKTTDTLEEAAGSAEKLSESLDEAGKSASDSGESLKEASDEAGNLADKKDGIDNLQKSLSSLAISAKKLGRDLSTYVTAPLAAIAGLSLKNLYDSGSIAQSSGAAREFALSVQSLKENFRQLTMELGTQLAPELTKFIALINNLVKGYRDLSPAAKTLVTSFAAIAAAVGPILLAFSGITGMFAKLIPIFKVIALEASYLAGAFASIPLIIASVALAIGGIINVFLKLRKAGVGAVEALQMSFNLLVTGFNNYVVGNILAGVNLILKGLSKVASLFSTSMQKSLEDASSSVDSVIKSLENKFDANKGVIDNKLSEIGSSAASAFSFGWNDRFGDIKDWFSGMFSSESGGKLESEMGKSFDEAFRTVEAKKKAHDLRMEMAEFEHQQKMISIDSSADPQEVLAQRISKEKEFLERRHQLELEDLQRSLELEQMKVNAIKDINEQRLAQKELNDRALIEKTDLTQRQELEAVELGNKAIEDSYKTRYDKAAQYVNMFSSGLSNAFLDIADGTKDLGKALEDFTKDFIRNMAQMIIQATIYKSVMQGLGLSAPGFSQGGAVGFASGGFVSGPGSSTSDSIPAWLSNGEYVIKASAVRKLGVGFLNGLNGVSSGSSFSRSKPNGFANGGLVTSPSSSVQVNIENQGTEKQVIESSYDPATAVVTVVLDDINKNGPMAKAFQNTFGVKRGGFR